MSLQSRWRNLALLATFGATAILCSTYARLTHTADEPLHIACGLEWWQRHSYTFERQHPPLSRIAVALGPHLLGAKPVKDKWDVDLYNDAVPYRKLLSAGRAGQIPFFLLLCWAVWAWACSLRSPRAAFVAVLLICTTPPVLAHAGLATTDLSVAALLAACCVVYQRWLEQPRLRTALILGALVGLGICSKFTFLLYGPVCLLAIGACNARRVKRIHLQQTGAVLAAAFLGAWGLYGFSIEAIPRDEPMALPAISAAPLSGMYRGIAEARHHILEGHESFLLGERRRFGWWFFFPLVFVLKTPIPLLALSLAALVRAMRWPLKTEAAPVLCAFGILACSIPSSVNLGVRHLLPMFPLLAVGAALTIERLLTARTPRPCLPRALVTVCLGWQAFDTARSWPDFIAYFNGFAGNAPELIRVDSDLDWGQGVAELAVWTRARNLSEPIGFYYFASADPSFHGLHWRPISPWTPASGWIAVSATELKMCRAPRPAGETRPAWWWLEEQTPVARVGGNIVYFVRPQ